MAAMAGLMQHSLTSARAFSGNIAEPMAGAASGAGGTGNSNSSDSSSATISANDFLSLLVTEMQNQDPTAQTDPNEYINQLVQVNSLEQLISINQNLSTALGTSGSSSGTGSGAGQHVLGQSAGPASASAAGGPASPAGAHASVVPGANKPSAATSPGAGVSAAIGRFAQSAGARQAPGNLEIPAAAPAARDVARALDGHSNTHVIPGRLPVAK